MIEFVALTDSRVEGRVSLRLPVVVRAYVDAPAEDEAYVSLEFVLSVEAEGELYVDNPIQEPSSVDLTVFLSFEAVATVHVDIDVDMTIPLSFFAGPSGATELNLGLRVDALEVIEGGAYGLLMMPSPQIMAYTGLAFAGVLDTFSVNVSPSSSVIYVLTERMLITDRVRPLAQLMAQVLERVNYTSHRVPVFLAAIEDDFDIQHEIVHEAYMVARIVDQLMLQDQTLGMLDALVIVVSAMVMRDRLVPIAQGELLDEVVFTPELVERIAALVEVAAELVLAADPEPSLLLFAAIRDVVGLGDDRSVLLSALATVFDSMDFALRFRVGDEVFIGYAVNIRNTAVTEYDNYPFNAMAFIGGRPYGTSDEGLFRLEGDDDDGTPISAMVRTGLTEFPELVRGANAWVVMTADGEMLFKTITGDDGSYEVATYRMHARPQGAAVETRFDLDKGYVGTAWGFELENVDGAYFELDSARFWPVTVGRRYSGR